MKFSFIVAFVCSNLYFSCSQFGGNFEIEVYEQDPQTGALRPVVTNRMRTTTKRYPTSNYEVYEYDPSSGSIKPVATPTGRMTTRQYQNNIFLNPSGGNQNTQTQTQSPLADNTSTMSLSTSTCDNYWTLQRDYNGFWGQLAIPSSNKEQSILKVYLSVATIIQSRYVGDISLAKDRQSTVNDVANGLPILYRVRFPVQNPIPKVTAIYYNNQLLCRGPKDVGDIVTTISLDHTLYTGLAQQNFQNNPNMFSTQSTPPPGVPSSRMPTQVVTTTTPPSIAQDSFVFPETITNRTTAGEERVGEFTSQCGIPYHKVQDTTGLVVKGKEAYKGQFPWLAAYYHNDIGDSGFICGGSLVSAKVVITAAHCIHNKQDEAIRQPEEALIYLGKYYLHSQPNERDFLVSGATKFVVHPSWSAWSESFDGDIAAVILLRTIQFTNFIRPICIWTSTQSYDDLINKQGVVAGYGKTEFTLTASDKPYWAELPIVDESTCLRSNTVFNKITSRRTFCAGTRDGRGPCNGDSGGGFLMKSNDKWYLRGIVSSALYDKEMYMCDTRNYAVFTDVAAFKDWILTQIETYG